VQGEQRERLVALAARAAVERDPAKFEAILLQLNKILQGYDPGLQKSGKNDPKSAS
jgi:hypothetical protein